MQHAGGETAVLPPHTRMEEPHHEIGILQTPTGIAAIEPVNTVEIIAEDRKIAGLRALPTAWQHTAMVRAAAAAPATAD